MVHLRLTRVSEDGRKLVLVSDARVEFTVDLDDRLRAAVAGELPTAGEDQGASGQLETQMESTLRPRDIQARIRAGETPESVAAAAQTTVDKVMPYAAPVLAEREHVAERAQRSSIRRPAGEAPHGEPRTPERPVAFDGFDGVRRAAGVVATRGRPVGAEHLIAANPGAHDAGGSGHARPSLARAAAAFHVATRSVKGSRATLASAETR